MPTQLNPSQDIRFAVVMYGGVSLACYINGVSQELFNIVRATAEDPGNRRCGLAEQELSGTQKVYRKLGQLLHRGERPPTSSTAVQPQDDIRTRFRIDILSGTSAGGINAIFLAKGLANDQKIDQLKQLWIEEGDISTLLNDNRPHGTPAKSLLDGKKMLRKLLAALDRMDQVPNGRDENFVSPHVEELDLYITTTDIRGLAMPLRLADRVIWEKRHRKVFHFLYSKAEATGQKRNDFLKTYNPFLAFAARCTSAFPFAFEPEKLADLDELVCRGAKAGSSEDPQWDTFLQEYLRPEAGSPAGATEKALREALKQRAFGDGGYLDNKPFSYAIDGLQRRRADLPVERKLIYIEPSPEHLQDEPKGRPDVDVIENVQAALLTLPSYETIREDLQRVLQRNHVVERVAHLTSGIEEDLAKRGTKLPPAPAWNTWGRKDLTEMIRTQGITFGGYHRLKVATLVDELAEAIALASGLDPESAFGGAIRYLVHAWREANFYRYASNRNGCPETENQMLVDYDLGYRIRRLLFVRGKIDALSSLDTQQLEILQSLLPLVETALENHMGEPCFVHFRAELENLQAMATQLGQEGMAVPKDLLAEASHRMRQVAEAAGILPPAHAPLQAAAAALHAPDSPFQQYAAAMSNPADGDVPLRLQEFHTQIDSMLADLDVARKQTPLYTNQEKAWRASVAALRGGTWPTAAANQFKAAFQAQLRELKPGLNEAFSMLRRLQREFWEPTRQVDGSVSGGPPGPFETFRKCVNDAKISEDALRSILEQSTEEERLAAAAALFRTKRADLECVAGFVKEQFSKATWDASDKCKEILYPVDPITDAALTEDVRLGRLLARVCARHYYDHFDQYDLVLFPVLYQTDVGEVAKVDIFRISPDDAKRESTKPKLAGTALFNFGGFLDRVWRVNDILWGRLDGAQRLITALLPHQAQAALRLELISAAHRSILQEELRPNDRTELAGQFVAALAKASAGAADDEVLREVRRELMQSTPQNAKLRAVLRLCLEEAALYDYFQKQYEVNRALDPERMVRLVARSTQIVGEMLEALSDRYPIGKSRAAWVMRLGQIFWGLVEAAAPRSFWNLVARHFLKLLYLLEAILLVGGTLLVNPTVQSFALLALAGTITAHLVMMLLSDLMQGKVLFWTVLKYVLAFVLAGLVVLGIFHVADMVEDENTQLLQHVKNSSKAVRFLTAGAIAAGGMVVYGIWKGLAWLRRALW
jgi:patatin-related protein